MISNFTFNYCFQRLIPELKLVALGVRHLPSHQSSTSNNLIYIWAKLKYNTLDIVSQVPLLNCCHLYSLITQLTSVNTISFCFFLPPFFFFLFLGPLETYSSNLLNSHTRWLKMINLWKFPMTKGTRIQGMHYLISFFQMG